MKQKLFERMVETITVATEKELEYEIAKRERNEAIEAYSEFCSNLTEEPVGEGSRIYAGTEDFVDFFKTVISTLGLDLDYEVEEVDGELEIVIKEVK